MKLRQISPSKYVNVGMGNVVAVTGGEFRGIVKVYLSSGAVLEAETGSTLSEVIANLEGEAERGYVRD